MKVQVPEYVHLLEEFVSGRIGAEAFEERFLELFKSDETMHPEAQFMVLDRLFAAVDSYCADPSLRDEHDFNEEQLWHESQVALDKLKALVD
jgi:hypothetical protein